MGESVSLELKAIDSDGRTVFESRSVLAKGTNAFDAMRSLTEVEYQQFSFGKLVTGIAGVSAPTNYYWALYVNGEYAMTGIEGITLNGDTLVEWKLEKIEN